MAIIIYTYSNPYKINREQYWVLIKNAFHLCVSQTLVNGLCDQYKGKGFYKGKLTTMNRFINNLYLDWESDAIEISQRAYIDNVIEYMNFGEYIDDDIDEEDIKTSLKRNRSYVLQSIRIMFELGMNPDNIRNELLTYEQKCIVGLYREILDSKSRLFSLKNDFTKSEVDEAIEKTIIEAAGNIDRDYSEINRETIVIHGIHQFTPIMLRTIEILSKYKNVVILFNYQPDYKNVYQTWLNVYSWFESKISLSAQNFNNESQEFEGGVIADNIAAMIAGSTSAIDLSNKIDVTEFDNQTEFAGYIAKRFEEATKKREADGFKHPTLYYMDEQIYSANSSVNEILKIYFPEQFGEREFLDYPLGHFFIAITNMWDPETRSMNIKDINDVFECLSCGIIEEPHSGMLVSILDKCKLYVSNETTIKAIIKKLKYLKGSLDIEDDQEDLLRLDYYNVSKEEVDSLIAALKELNSIASQFFEDFNDNQNDFKIFYKKIADVLVNKVLDKQDLDKDFKDIVIRVLARLKEVESVEASASFDCLRETMQLYLHQLPLEGRGANWIVRNFEQIDGDVLRKNAKDHEKTYHFACLSDQDMSITHKDEFPWPLDIGFFEVAQAPVDWKYQVYVTSRLEYKNFRRYALVYGLGFSKSKVKLSYIKNSNDTEKELYYLFRVLNADIHSYTPGDFNSFRKDSSYIEINTAVGKKFNQYDLMKYRLCKYRFLIDSIVESRSVYKDEFLMRKYLTIVLENRAKRHFAGKNYIKNVVLSYLNDQMDELSGDFPFISQLDVFDVINETSDYLEKYAVKLGKFTALKASDIEFMTKREEFLSVPVGKQVDEGFGNIFKSSTQDEVDYTLAFSNFDSEKYHKSLNALCDKCADKEICIEIYSLRKK